MIHHLLVAADRYAIERLKLVCQSILCESLDVQTVATTSALADQNHCDMLKDACIQFITSSNAFDAVARTEGYKNLKRTCPSVTIDVLEKACKQRQRQSEKQPTCPLFVLGSSPKKKESLSSPSSSAPPQPSSSAPSFSGHQSKVRSIPLSSWDPRHLLEPHRRRRRLSVLRPSTEDRGI
ncbi:hypothetical protein EJB05_09050, partial [Eragrostis curvula]